MSNEHMALVIDNVQDFGEPLRYFLDKYINYSRHQSRSNRSILLLSINIDKADKNTLNFIESIQELQNDYDTFYVHETSGFNISSQALIFLKELLNEKTGRFDKELEQVINRYSTIPYYLWQFVYNLLDNDIAYYDENNKCRIKDPTKFFDVTLELHDPKELLRKRWSRLLDRSLFEEQDYIRILSLISLIPNVQESTIRDFNLKFSCLDILTKYNFIRKNRSGNYVFDHDIVERFMVEYYGSHYFIILEHIKIEGLERQIINRPFISNLYKINQKDISVAEVKEVADYVYDNKPSLLFMKPFLEMLIKQINANIENFNGNEEWLNYIVRTCNILRNNIGFDESLDYYETINNVIIKKGVANFSRTITFRNYIDTYSDLLHHIRRSDEAITYLKSILTKLPKLEDDDIANALYSMIYNRLLINYREYESVQARYDVIECYNKSIDYAMHIQDKNLRNEFIYLNQSDLGYIYYSIKENKEELLKIWKECLNFPPEILPQKTLNYYRKMVQISLINQNVENAEKNILFIRKHLNEISYTAQHMIFDMFCLMSESICLILKNPVANYTELKSIFVELMRISRLRGGKRIYEILNLKAIVAYYNEDYDTMEESFKKAYELMRNAKPTMHLSVKRAFLVNNIIYAYQSLNKNSSIKNIVEDYIDKELMDDYSAQSILYTPDEKFNFMPIV